MPNLIQTFNWGSTLKNNNPELYRQLSTAYTNTAIIVNVKVSKYFTDGLQKPHMNPPANDPFNINFEIGDVFVRTDTDQAWMMTSRTTSSAVTWTLIT